LATAGCPLTGVGIGFFFCIITGQLLQQPAEETSLRSRGCGDWSRWGRRHDLVQTYRCFSTPSVHRVLTAPILIRHDLDLMTCKRIFRRVQIFTSEALNIKL
jgi:hypothetical protein